MKYKADIIYLAGFLIFITALLYKPYSKEFLRDKVETNKFNIEKDILIYEKINHDLIVEKEANDSLICLIEEYIDTANLNKIQLKNTKHLLDSLYNKVDRADKYLKKGFGKLLIKATEYDAGVSQMININQIFFYGMMTVSLMLMIGSRTIFSKKEQSEKYIRYKQNLKQGTDDKKPT
jgi:hypothetical protein